MQVLAVAIHHSTPGFVPAPKVTDGSPYPDLCGG